MRFKDNVLLDSDNLNLDSYAQTYLSTLNPFQNYRSELTFKFNLPPRQASHSPQSIPANLRIQSLLRVHIYRFSSLFN